MPRGVAKAKDGNVGNKDKGDEVGKVVVGKRSRKMRGGGETFKEYCEEFVKKYTGKSTEFKIFILTTFKSIENIIVDDKTLQTTGPGKSIERRRQINATKYIKSMTNENNHAPYIFDKITFENLIEVLSYIDGDFKNPKRKAFYTKGNITNDILQTLYKNIFFLKIFKLIEEFKLISQKEEITSEITIEKAGDKGNDTKKEHIESLTKSLGTDDDKLGVKNSNGNFANEQENLQESLKKMDISKETLNKEEMIEKSKYVVKILNNSSRFKKIMESYVSAPRNIKTHIEYMLFDFMPLILENEKEKILTKEQIKRQIQTFKEMIKYEEELNILLTDFITGNTEDDFAKKLLLDAYKLMIEILPFLIKISEKHLAFLNSKETKTEPDKKDDKDDKVDTSAIDAGWGSTGKPSELDTSRIAKKEEEQANFTDEEDEEEGNDLSRYEDFKKKVMQLNKKLQSDIENQQGFYIIINKISNPTIGKEYLTPYYRELLYIAEKYFNIKREIIAIFDINSKIADINQLRDRLSKSTLKFDSEENELIQKFNKYNVNKNFNDDELREYITLINMLFPSVREMYNNYVDLLDKYKQYIMKRDTTGEGRESSFSTTLNKSIFDTKRKSNLEPIQKRDENLLLDSGSGLQEGKPQFNNTYISQINEEFEKCMQVIRELKTHSNDKIYKEYEEKANEILKTLILQPIEILEKNYEKGTDFNSIIGEYKISVEELSRTAHANIKNDMQEKLLRNAIEDTLQRDIINKIIKKTTKYVKQLTYICNQILEAAFKANAFIISRGGQSRGNQQKPPKKATKPPKPNKPINELATKTPNAKEPKARKPTKTPNAKEPKQKEPTKKPTKKPTKTLNTKDPKQKEPTKKPTKTPKPKDPKAKEPTKTPKQKEPTKIPKPKEPNAKEPKQKEPTKKPTKTHKPNKPTKK